MSPIAPLLSMPVDELRATARRLGLPVPASPWKEGLVTAIAHHQRPPDDAHFGCGVLEVHGEGFGFLRSPYADLLPASSDIYVSQSQIRRFHLQTGDTVIGRVRPPKEQERYPALLKVELINGEPPDVEIVPFDERKAVYPSTRLPLTRDPGLQVIDWVAPLGLGARGLLGGSARSERSSILRRLASTFGADPDLSLWVLLLGERPEEITDWRDQHDVEIVATPFDETAQRHLQVAEITLQRARRMAERGAEVVILLDSLSRLLQYAAADADTAGRMVDGVDSAALQRVRQLFATGRDLRDAGSVTLIGTVDVDAGSSPLLRQLSDAATWQLVLRDGTGMSPSRGPGRVSVDVQASWARREDLLLPPDDAERRRQWRARLPDDPAGEAAALQAVFKGPVALDSSSATGQ